MLGEWRGLLPRGGGEGHFGNLTARGGEHGVPRVQLCEAETPDGLSESHRFAVDNRQTALFIGHDAVEFVGVEELLSLAGTRRDGLIDLNSRGGAALVNPLGRRNERVRGVLRDDALFLPEGGKPLSQPWSL